MPKFLFFTNLQSIFGHFYFVQSFFFFWLDLSCCLFPAAAAFAV